MDTHFASAAPFSSSSPLHPPSPSSNAPLALSLIILTHSITHKQANLTKSTEPKLDKATLVKEYELMLNTTKAAIANIQNFTDVVLADKKAKLSNMKTALKPSTPAPQKAGVASFVVQGKPAGQSEPKPVPDCWDEAPKDNSQFSCEQQRDWGKCGEGFMVTADAPQHGYCAKTCGRC